MGRKRIREIKQLDKIGEPVDLEKCPECNGFPDCFSYMEGKCTALNESGDKDCVFYCPEQKAITESKMAYQKLKDSERVDLIGKYFKTLTALGVITDSSVDSLD